MNFDFDENEGNQILHYLVCVPVTRGLSGRGWTWSPVNQGIQYQFDL